MFVFIFKKNVATNSKKKERKKKLVPTGRKNTHGTVIKIYAL